MHMLPRGSRSRSRGENDSRIPETPRGGGGEEVSEEVAKAFDQGYSLGYSHALERITMEGKIGKGVGKMGKKDKEGKMGKGEIGIATGPVTAPVRPQHTPCHFDGRGDELCTFFATETVRTRAGNRRVCEHCAGLLRWQQAGNS